MCIAGERGSFGSYAFKMPPTGASWRGGRRQGQILVITLLAMTLLVGLIFYVYNVGDQVNRRLELQNAADAAAISGAAWMARSMNVIAMNNVTQVRLIALALVLDSMPLAAEMTVAEETGVGSLPIPLEEQLERDVWPIKLDPTNFLHDGLEEIHRQLTRRGTGKQPDTHLDLIETIDRKLDQRDELETEGGFDVAEATQWSIAGRNGSLPHGTIWQAIKAVDELSRAVAASAGVLAQANAVRFGKANRAETAMLVPVEPNIPVQLDCTFQDFQPVLSDHIDFINDPASGAPYATGVLTQPVERLRRSADILKEIETVGVRGGAIPDFAWPHRVGPFARVYGWRDYHWREEGEWWQTHYRRLRIGYSTYGPLEHALRIVLTNFGQMGTQYGGIAYTSRFPHHLRRIAKLKLAYMLELPAPQKIQYSDEWITDYHQARKFIGKKENRERVLRTRYYRVVVDSKYDPGPTKKDPRWLTGRLGEMREERTFHSWQIRPPLSGPITNQPLQRWALDWNGVRILPYSDQYTDKVANHVWIRRYKRRVREYRRFNWPPRPILDKKGNITGYDRYTLYRVEWYVWGGMEIRNEVEISDLLAGADDGDLPAPILLETSGEEEPEEVPGGGWRVKPFEYLGVATSSDQAKFWHQKFASRNPQKAALALAQAKLFNNTSWDLWTQDWRVQLTPISRWNEWLSSRKWERDANLPIETGLTVEDVEFVHQYMEKLPKELVDLYLNH